MKRRLYHSTLAEMELALAREKTLAKKILCALQRASLVKLMRVHNEQIADEIGMIDKVAPLRAHPEERDVAECGLSSEKSRRVTSKLSKMSADEVWLLRWRKFRYHLTTIMSRDRKSH